jgi:P-type Cu+ transporter
MLTPASPKLKNSPSIQCYHCGDSIKGTSYEYDTKTFCCEGCRSVYEVLEAGGMCQFYDLEKSPGQKVSVNSNAAIEALTLHEVAEHFILYQDATKTKVRFFIPAIHCSSCIWLLENLAQLADGIERSEVQFVRKEVYITFDQNQISIKEVAAWLYRIGYPPRLEKENQNQTLKGRSDKRLLFQIGVAGFCFGNIMLLSFPEYLGLSRQADPKFVWLFSSLNILLSLPVLLYAGQDYFKAAYLSIKQKTLSLDVPIALGMSVLFIQSTYDIISHQGAGYLDSLAGLVFFLLLGKWFQSFSYQSLSFDTDYSGYFPLAVKRIKGDQEETVAIDAIDAGDTLLIRNGELLAADARLIEGAAQMDYSFITGETLPQTRNTGDYLYAGGRQCGAAIKVQIEKKPSASYFVQLWNQDRFRKPEQSTLGTLSGQLSRNFTIGILIISFIASVWWMYYDATRVWFIISSVLIIACPCALALTIPFSYGHAIRLLGKQGLFLRKTSIVEKLANIQHIIFDKTGTITYTDQAEISFVGKTIDEKTLAAIGSAAWQSTHPLSRLIANYLDGIYDSRWTLIEEFPGKGLRAVAPNLEIKLGKSEWAGGIILEEATENSRSHVAINGEYKGYFSIRNRYRAGFATLAKSLQEHYPLHVLSGDNDSERKPLAAILGEKTGLHFSKSPFEKQAFIQDLEQQGKQTLMVGDGINDAGALRFASVGMAVTEDIHQFAPASDALIKAEVLPKLQDFLAFAKEAKRTVKQSLVVSLAYNAVGLSFALTGNISPIVAAIMMPLSSVTVVGFITLRMNWVAKRLG